ncbi:hypothetical protein LTR53_002927 [Teratosphaeriaceae sp. CCFEE 6253]|nr:hypothetical protein LTR53_002927 [Teratosphaeriaceae sp. CCFEE 6253]
MAPTNEHIAVTVVSTRVQSTDDGSILVEAGGFTPARWFLEHTAQASLAVTEPPRKKRRVMITDPMKPAVASQEPSVDADIAHAIPIHRVTIDLHFPDSLHSTSAEETAVQDDLDFVGANELAVVPCIVHGDDGGPALQLVAPRKLGAVLTIECSHIPQSTRDALRRIAPPTYAVQRRMTNPATIIRCTLKRSVGRTNTVLRLEASILWRSGISAFPKGMPVGRARVYDDYTVLAEAYHDSARDGVDHTQPWTPHDFYDSVHVPDKSVSDGGLLHELLDTELYPFQERAVLWMLRREGMEYSNKRLTRITKNEREGLHFGHPVLDADGKPCFVNYLQGIMSRESLLVEEPLSGGLLAEEMGLGKTVELLALVALHRRDPVPYGTVFDAPSDTDVTRSKATLIITPPTILQQWASEIARHAPSLKVHRYTGIENGDRSDEHSAKVIERLANDYDVVLATYPTLAHELHFAEDPPDRNMRHARKFVRKRSPLVQIQWWRICLDEAQMVESGVTAAARVACRLPRVHSWAVTGTPLRKNVQDLHGLLIFLRYKPLSDNAMLWSHLVTNHRHLFRQIWSDIALRHTKAYVREELRLPPQKRVVLSVPFSAIEQQHYGELFTQMCEDVGLHADGSPKAESWDPQDPATVETMRSWLVRLRQTCLHPQVGGRNRKALGRGAGPLRTIGEVLAVMVEQNETTTRTEERLLLSTKLLRAHILGNNGEDILRSSKSLERYTQAMETSAGLVQDARERLTHAKATASEQGEATTDAETDVDDSATESTPLLGRLRNNLRTALLLQHASNFFAATATFQIKTDESLTQPGSEDFKQLEERETSLYDIAKQLRKEILRDSARKAELTMRKIKDVTRGKSKVPVIADLELSGIESRRLVEKSDEVFDVIRELAQQIAKMRLKMAEYLLKPLVDEDEEGLETTGEEYEASTKQQDELYAYFDVIKAMHADLNGFVTGESAPLIDHEIKVLTKDLRWYFDPEIETTTVPHAPELLQQLLPVRERFRKRRDEVGSIRGLIQEARGLETTFQGQSSVRQETEHALTQQHLAALQKIFRDYTKALGGMEKELDLFRTAQNQRLEFYRQLQEVSDAVAPHKDELDPTLDLPALELAMAREEHQSTTLAQLRTKSRFLLHLRDESGSQGSPKICVICQCTFENGVLTVCGHQYCKECIQHWWTQHRTCPVCKRRLHTADFHNITYKPQELKAQEEVQSGSSSPGDSAPSTSPSALSSIYSDVDTKLMDEIKSIDLPASYGTKIDTLGRHLLWIREHDPGAKSIVFSQYREFLDVLGTALKESKISHSRLGKTGAVEKFRHDPSIDCLLLDAKTDSSGLTLVNATHVFVCEPLIQTAVELQAIARVHRIGQTRPTTVWMYLVNDTVEEAIYEISVARRLAHVQSRQGKGNSRSTTPAPLGENAIDAANSEELQSAPLSKLLVNGKGGGEMVGNGDLWQCLFGKAQKATTKPSMELEQEVGRHQRAEAAVQRMVAEQA